MADNLMIVYAQQLLDAADEMEDRGSARGSLKNGVTISPAQLRTAGEILRDGPQPVCNGIEADMPGLIDSNAQTDKSLIFQVGILPSKLFRIDELGRKSICIKSK